MNYGMITQKQDSNSPLLSREEFHALSDVPPEIEWFSEIENKNTKRAYFNDVKSFMVFVGIQTPQEFRHVTRAHIIAWRKTLADLSPATIRRKLSALASLFDYMCESNAITHNPVHGIKRPKGKSEPTKSLSDDQVRILLQSPPEDTLKGRRDRAILSVLVYHALRREELSKLRVKDFYVLDRGIPHFRIRGKGGKDRYIPMHPVSIRLINDYLDTAGHRESTDSPLFLVVKNNNPSGGSGCNEKVSSDAPKMINSNSVQRDIVRHYSEKTGIYFEGLSPHALRKTSATNALDHNADLKRVQDWLGHSNISTTQIYDGRGTKPEDSPTFKVSY